MLITQDYAKRLARLLVDRKIILFVGAGISLQAKSIRGKGARLPLWGELAEKVAERTGESLARYGGDLFDMFDSIARKTSRATLDDAVRSAIPEDEFEPGPMHQLIAELPWSRIYTTNYDNLLIRALGEKFPIVNERDYELLSRPVELQPRLVHLHGTLAQMHTLGGRDYKRWSERHPLAHNRLIVDGTENTILFLGYSNSDPHFRQLILPMIQELKADRGQNNHSWMWRPSTDQIELFNDRDRLEVHAIELDSEWVDCLEIVKEEYSRLAAAPGVAKAMATSGPKASGIAAERAAKINGYKLFYYRDIRSISRANLAKRSGVDARRIAQLEKVNTQKSLGPGCFKACTPEEIRALEKALKSDTALEYGKSDDFLAYYIEYYKNNWRQPRAKGAPQQDSLFSGRTRAVVFDFGGTLTVPQFKENTWERIWKSVGFTLEEANKLHHLFSAGKISHKQWCDLTCEYLRNAGFSKDHFASVYEDIQAMPGLKGTFEELRSRGIEIHIVSGSLRTIIETVLDDASRYVDSIRSNEMFFDKDRLLSRISGHNYDFEGKAKFVKLVAEGLNCHPIDVLFIGNSLNDEKAATSGARTLCVNPRHTHYYVESMWNNTIREMTDLSQILPFL